MNWRTLTTAWSVSLLVMMLLAGRAAAAAPLAFTPCPAQPGVGCARLAVALDRSGRTPGTVSLALRRLSGGPVPSQDAVVGLAGGPGQAAIPLIRTFAQWMAPALRTRDLIVFDQRGTGGSSALSCPALTLAGAPGQVAKLCALELGPARASFTTADSVADLEAIRVAAGYRKLVLFGVSYGTKVALEYAERYPQNVEALVLDSTVTVTGPDPLQRSTFAAIPHALDDLCSVNACARITTDPQADIAALVHRMERAPISGHVFDGNGRRVKQQMGRGDLLNLLVAGDLNPALRAELPAAVRSALRGDPASLLRLNLLAAGLLPDLARRRATSSPRLGAQPSLWPTERSSPPGTSARAHQTEGAGFDQALYTDTICEEESFPWTRNAPARTRLAQAEAAVNALSRAAVYPFDRLTALLGGDIPLCLDWPVASPAPPGDAPLPTVPTLILSGADDLRAPSSDAQGVANAIPGSHLVVVPHTGHSVLGSDLSNCAQNAVNAFFAGAAVAQCGALPNVFAPTAVPPTRLGQVPRAGGVAGRAGRTLTAVLSSLVDLRREIIGAELNANAVLPSGAHFGGLRGGAATLTARGVVLRAYSFVPGVNLSGTVPTRLLTLGAGRSASLAIAGSQAAHGLVVLQTGNRASGHLDGHRFRVAVAASASVSAQWPATLPPTRTLIP